MSKHISKPAAGEGALSRRSLAGLASALFALVPAGAIAAGIKLRRATSTKSIALHNATASDLRTAIARENDSAVSAIYRAALGDMIADKDGFDLSFYLTK